MSLGHLSEFSLGLKLSNNLSWPYSIAGELIIWDGAAGGGGDVSQGVKLRQFVLGFTSSGVNVCQDVLDGDFIESYVSVYDSPN